MYQPKNMKLHFVGIGGIGMSGIATVFLNQGFQVSGSDSHSSDITHNLEKLGAKIYIGHKPENILGVNVVIISSAIRSTNPEVIEARKKRIPIIPRAEMLGELMRGKVGIAVAGSHGKTTTTSMLATILTHAHLDPTSVIGGKVDALGGNARFGQGKFVVAEADESDGSFLHLPATLGIITNIDNDHLDHFGTIERLEDAFIEFVAQLPFYGLAAICAEDEGVKRCIGRMTKPFLTYGFSSTFDLYAKNVTLHHLGSSFEVWVREPGQIEARNLGEIQLSVLGKHNVLNALGSIAIARRLDIPFEKIQESLSSFQGVKRRFDIRWADTHTHRAIVDDYGHHPTEIQATLAAARTYWPKGRIISVFQPHRYSRTIHCWDGFLSAFSQSDVVLITDIYSAGEEVVEGIHSEKLASEMNKISNQSQKIYYTGNLESTQKKIEEIFAQGDLILCQGAGSITHLPQDLINWLKQSSTDHLNHLLVNPSAVPTKETQAK